MNGTCNPARVLARAEAAKMCMQDDFAPAGKSNVPEAVSVVIIHGSVLGERLYECVPTGTGLRFAPGG